jgi:xylulokinase
VLAMQYSGNPPVPAWLGFNIQWLKKHEPDLYMHTWMFLTSQGYVNYRLTGKVATDWTEASGSFLMEASSKSWSPELVSYLGLDLDKLAPLKPSYEVLGSVTPDAAARTGLKIGTPVVVGAGDMLCMLISAGLTQHGRAADITGTASIMAVYVDEPVRDARLMNLHHAIPGWIPFGISDSGGGALKWFKDSLCDMQNEQARRAGKDVYEFLNPMAAEVEPGSEGLLFFPYLMGERSMGSPFSRGVFFGLTPRSNRGAMVRAIMEGVTFELRRTLAIVQDAGNQVDQIYTIGGGARSDLWSQIKADIYQKPVHTFEASEGGILGAAILAGVGAGVYLDVRAAASRCLRLKKTFSPDPSRSARYDHLYKLFLDVHDRMQEPFERLARIP